MTEYEMGDLLTSTSFAAVESFSMYVALINGGVTCVGIFCWTEHDSLAGCACIDTLLYCSAGDDLEHLYIYVTFYSN
jgi:hypothetical protein